MGVHILTNYSGTSLDMAALWHTCKLYAVKFACKNVQWFQAYNHFRPLIVGRTEITMGIGLKMWHVLPSVAVVM